MATNNQQLPPPNPNAQVVDPMLVTYQTPKQHLGPIQIVETHSGPRYQAGKGNQHLRGGQFVGNDKVFNHEKNPEKGFEMTEQQAANMYQKWQEQTTPEESVQPELSINETAQSDDNPFSFESSLGLPFEDSAPLPKEESAQPDRRDAAEVQPESVPDENTNPFEHVNVLGGELPSRSSSTTTPEPNTTQSGSTLPEPTPSNTTSPPTTSSTLLGSDIYPPSSQQETPARQQRPLVAPLPLGDTEPQWEDDTLPDSSEPIPPEAFEWVDKEVAAGLQPEAVEKVSQDDLRWIEHAVGARVAYQAAAEERVRDELGSRGLEPDNPHYDLAYQSLLDEEMDKFRLQLDYTHDQVRQGGSRTADELLEAPVIAGAFVLGEPLPLHDEGVTFKSRAKALVARARQGVYAFFHPARPDQSRPPLYNQENEEKDEKNARRKRLMTAALVGIGVVGMALAADRLNDDSSFDDAIEQSADQDLPTGSSVVESVPEVSIPIKEETGDSQPDTSDNEVVDEGESNTENSSTGTDIPYGEGVEGEPLPPSNTQPVVETTPSSDSALESSTESASAGQTEAPTESSVEPTAAESNDSQQAEAQSSPEAQTVSVALRPGEAEMWPWQMLENRQVSAEERNQLITDTLSDYNQRYGANFVLEPSNGMFWWQGRVINADELARYNALLAEHLENPAADSELPETL